MRFSMRLARYQKAKRTQAELYAEAARATTDRTCELLEDIRNHCQDALNFIPGHFMKDEYRTRLEASLMTIRKELYELSLLGQEPGEAA